MLSHPEANLFDGIVVDTRLGPGGHRFVDAPEVDAIAERAVTLTLDAAAGRAAAEAGREPGGAVGGTRRRARGRADAQAPAGLGPALGPLLSAARREGGRAARAAA